MEFMSNVEFPSYLWNLHLIWPVPTSSGGPSSLVLPESPLLFPLLPQRSLHSIACVCLVVRAPARSPGLGKWGLGLSISLFLGLAQDLVNGGISKLMLNNHSFFTLQAMAHLQVFARAVPSTQMPLFPPFSPMTSFRDHLQEAIPDS